MKKVSLLYHTFAGTLNNVSILPKRLDTECEFQLTITEGEEQKNVTIHFSEVAALEFSMNFSDCPEEGSDLGGFYKVPGRKHKRHLLERNIKRRRKEWLMTRLSGLTEEKDEPELPELTAETLDLVAQMEAACGKHQLYLLQSMSGAWLILAKAYECLEQCEG